MVDTVRTQAALLARMIVDKAGAQLGKRGDVLVQTLRDLVVSVPGLAGAPGGATHSNARFSNTTDTVIATQSVWVDVSDVATVGGTESNATMANGQITYDGNVSRLCRISFALKMGPLGAVPAAINARIAINSVVVSGGEGQQQLTTNGTLDFFEGEVVTQVDPGDVISIQVINNTNTDDITFNAYDPGQGLSDTDVVPTTGMLVLEGVG